MSFRNLLVKVGLAAGNVAAKFDPTGIASHILEAYGKQREKEQLRSELDEMMSAGFVKFRAVLSDAMGELRLQLAESARGQVEAYLSQFQASAKQAARIFGDPSATTVPATVAVEEPAQLAAFLPQRVPRFTVGNAVPGLPSWKLTEPLGSGGFGEVWKAENPYSGTAAFKFFLDPTARCRFTRMEAENLAKILLEAPTTGVVKLLGAEPGQDPPWLQFEYISGGDLSALPEEWKGLSNSERVSRVRTVIGALAATVGHFHKLNVVHRDLKPSNILLRTDRSLVIADFGISKIIPAGLSELPTPTNSGTATIRAYTALYASPQQKKFRPADKRDDVYALGVLWYQLLRGDLTLERPGGEGWKRALEKLGLTETMIALLGRCWDDEPDERPSDGNALLASLMRTQSIPPPPAVIDNPQSEPLGRFKPGETRVQAAKRLGLDGPPSAPIAARKPGETVEFPLPGGLKMAFCWIPPGTAQLGSPKAEREAAIRAGAKPEWVAEEGEEKRGVYTSKGCWLAKYPVTQAEWHDLTGEKPSYFRTGAGGADKVKGLDTSRFPVESVSWDDCQEFMEKLNGHAELEIFFGNTGQFVLPHENEWEHACRGGKGNKQAYYWGNQLNGTQSNCNGNNPFGKTAKGLYWERPTPVGTYSANFPHPWGLCDMHGNVWEWCENFYEQEENRSLRGGAWSDDPAYCRSACRSWSPSALRESHFGFRVCFRLD